MNIFVLDNDPELAARFLKWGHVPKMIVESTQLLSNCFPEIIAPYKRTHYNHPCAIWVRESKQNFVWLHIYAKTLCFIYTDRQNRTHACEEKLDWMLDRVSLLYFPKKGQTKFALAMPDEYKQSNPVLAYRNYYNGEKLHIRPTGKITYA